MPSEMGGDLCTGLEDSGPSRFPRWRERMFETIEAEEGELVLGSVALREPKDQNGSKTIPKAVAE